MKGLDDSTSMNPSVSVAYQLWLDTANHFLVTYPCFKKWMVAAGLGCCLLVIRSAFIYTRDKWHKYPPTLYGVPVFGSLFTMLYHGEHFNTKILPQCGPIVSHHIGSLFSAHNVTINDANLIGMP